MYVCMYVCAHRCPRVYVSVRVCLCSWEDCDTGFVLLLVCESRLRYIILAVFKFIRVVHVASLKINTLDTFIPVLIITEV